MSWSFGNVPQGPAAATATAGGQQGEIVVSDLAFQNLATGSEDRLRVSQPWPTDNLPSNTASLLSIASQKGLVAYATPDSLCVVSTEKARVRYLMRRKEGEPATQHLEADINLAVPRVSHVAFSCDESCLVIAAEQSGGLAIYHTSGLSSTSQPAFEIATNGTSVRHLLPNPKPASELAHMFGIVLTDGKLLLADLQKRELVRNARDTHILHEHVSCAAWSKLGKQIIAGLQDSTASQIDAQGNVKDRIPKPPQLTQIQEDYEGATEMPVTSISWISTHDFLLVLTPTYPTPKTEDEMRSEDSVYFLVKRKKNGPFVFYRFDVDPCMPFGMQSRVPPQHFITRLTEWMNISDLLLVSSTSSSDIGLLGKFKDNKDDEFFTITIDEDRNGRASLPVSEETQEETSTIGMALDFGTKEVAPAPIPNQADVYRHSVIPLPAMYLLTTDGILLMWWFVYGDAIKQKAIYPGMVHKGGAYAKYKKYNKATVEDDPYNPHQKMDEESDDETEAVLGVPATTQAAPILSAASSQLRPTSSTSSKVRSQPPSQSLPAPIGSSDFSQLAATTPSFGQNTASNFGTSGGIEQKANIWSTQTSSVSSASTFGKASTLGGGSTFGQASIPGGTSNFTKPTMPNGSATFGQASRPGTFGQVSQPSGTFRQMGLNKPSPFSSSSGESPFAKFATNTSPFVNAAKQASPFAAAARNLNNNPSLSKETSTGSTATLGSSDLGSFGHASAFPSSSFLSRPSLSMESTMNEDSTKPESSIEPRGGLFGLGSGGFKLGSGFKGDGTAADDLPKPVNPGAGFFGALGTTFGDAVNSSDGNKEAPVIKSEPGTAPQPALTDIAAAKPLPQHRREVDDAPLPPDPSTYKAPKMPDVSEILGTAPQKTEAPTRATFPTNPVMYKAPQMPVVSTSPGVSGPTSKQNVDKDEPIAGSPPLNVTKSQTFSSDEGSEIAGPADDGEGDLEGLSGEGGEEFDDESVQADDDDDDVDEDDYEDVTDEADEEDEEDDQPYQVQNQNALDAFKARMQPPSPKQSFPKTQARTPPSDQKPMQSSYTPAGLPKGPVFPPPEPRAEQSPRSPSPQRRTVTSPVGKHLPLPSQIKTSAVPPAKPIEKPTAAPKPREPSAGELEDEAYARVEALLSAPIEPTKELPVFYSHTDYTGSVDKPGIGGQVEKVFRDVNSMLHVIGLNARSLSSFLAGQLELRKSGMRTPGDLEDPVPWCLGDLHSLTEVMETLGKQLDAGKLDRVRNTLADIAVEEKEMSRIKLRTVEVRRHILAHTDPERIAIQGAAPLSAEAQIQQTELRQGMQRVQKLLSEVEQKMTLLRADLASLSRGNPTTTPVPTVQAVTNTIQRMTTMVQQRSGDIDLLESQIRRLPNGIASLRLNDDYETDLALKLADSRLLTTSAVTTPQRRLRIAANGDALGMSAMFGADRYQTPPSDRRSMKFTSNASGLNGSTGSLSRSTRKKMNDVTEQEVEAFQARLQRRKDVFGALKSRTERNGVTTVKVK